MAVKKQRRVVLTRENNEALTEILTACDIDVLQIPLVKIEYCADSDETADIFGELGSYNWITFSSPNAVRGFFKAFFETFDDIRSIGISHLACVGESTARELEKYYLHPDVVPAQQNSAAMADAMAEFETLGNLKMLAVRGDKGLRDYINKLEEHFAAIVDEFVVYKNLPITPEPSSPAVKSFKKNGADAVVFASPSAVENFAAAAKILSTDADATRPKIVSIGATTSDAIRKFGMQVAIESKNPSAEAIAEAIAKILK